MPEADTDALRRELVQAFDASPVLDGATGNGVSIDLLRSRGLWAVATDLEPAKLRGREPAVVCDLRRLPFRSGEMGGVMLSFCLHHVTTHDGRAWAMREAARVLKSGGVVAVGDWREPPDFHRGWQMPDPELLAEAARAAGLEVLELELRGPLFKLVARKP